MLTKLFLDHPRDAGESYCEHLAFAASIGGTMLMGGLACLIHGLAPWTFQTTGSRLLGRAQQMIAERRAAAARPMSATGWKTDGGSVL